MDQLPRAGKLRPCMLQACVWYIHTPFERALGLQFIPLPAPSTAHRLLLRRHAIIKFLIRLYRCLLGRNVAMSYAAAWPVPLHCCDGTFIPSLIYDATGGFPERNFFAT